MRHPVQTKIGAVANSKSRDIFQFVSIYDVPYIITMHFSFKIDLWKRFSARLISNTTKNVSLCFNSRISWNKIFQSLSDENLEDQVSSIFIVYSSTPSIDEVPKNVIHTPMLSKYSEDYVLALADGSCQLYSFSVGKDKRPYVMEGCKGDKGLRCLVA